MSRNPHLSNNSDYHAARAVEERRLAMAAKDPNARAAHLELAAKYAEIAKTGGREAPDIVGEQQRAG